tara:strand:+ start:2584 stop:2742 length:159 start_codon:yes stop_codon:yes gene_type:complete
MVKIEFTSDYATKKQGNIAEYDGQLASTLISLGVAKLFKEAKEVKEKPKKSK